ncbi:hypothetical protein Tco_1529779, partial [Tanacetum coccineum]
MQVPKELITNNIRNAPYYNSYLEIVAKHDRKVAAEEGGKKKSAAKADQPKKPATSKQTKPVSSKQSKPASAKQSKLVKEKSTKPTPLQKAGKGKGKGITTDEHVAQSLPAAQLEDDTSTNIIRNTPSPTDAETGAETDKTNSEGDTEILNIGEEQGEDVAKQVNLEDKTTEIDEGQAGSDLGKTPESRPPPERVLMEEDQAGPDPKPMHDDFVATISTGTLSSMKNLDAYTFIDQFFNDKPTKEEPDKANMETEVESMVTVPIHQASSSVPPISTPDKTVQGLSSRVFDLELRDLPYKIDETVREAVKEAVQIALQAPLKERFRDLSEADIKEILHDR